MAENPRAGEAVPIYRRSGAQMTPRYSYFIQVEEEALRENYVNLVKADWKPDLEDEKGNRDAEAIEGYTGEEDIGWFRVSPAMLGAYLWDSINDESWHVHYRRPPAVLLS